MTKKDDIIGIPAVQNPPQIEICRSRGVRHCAIRECPLYVSCPMSLATEQADHRSGGISLWQVPHEDGEPVHELFSNDAPYISPPQKTHKKKK